MFNCFRAERLPHSDTTGNGPVKVGWSGASSDQSQDSQNELLSEDGFKTLDFR